LANPPLAADTTPVDSGLLGQPYDTLEITSYSVLDELTPRLSQVAPNGGG
jgi:hypothetical protein